MSRIYDAFTVCGIEIEYGIVDKTTLDCRPIADQVLIDPTGAVANEIARGPFAWSNEFAWHVLEVKTREPVASLDQMLDGFQGEVQALNQRLDGFGTRLMPTAMHPWMNPSREAMMWPNDPEGIYGTYSRIFDTRTHGWANLQSVHVNLPFADEAQFVRLHEAIRLILPIIPALAASSPVADGRLSGVADYRLVAYRNNAPKHPAIAGRVIPETVSGRAQYEETVLAPMYRSIAASDPEGVLQDEWLNSRGAIARFQRQSIEIRLIDAQECPLADLSVAAAVIAAVRLLYDEGAFAAPPATESLVDIFDACVAKADEATIAQTAYLDRLGYSGRSCSARDLWQHLITRAEESRVLTDGFWKEPLGIILKQGSLARRIERALGRGISRSHLKDIYGELCDCLHEGKMFLP
ncbi:carboxylate-amine ligase [Microvirga puerhi]|uniref:Glutamate--cysteine ligase n=1 Tax=Microvirga puerhi TaxID=2876078 RepID=A0ABS7VH42_9HYPH|nr:glutamate-cysteine ligase family protein [Microvirga puerhi]MBZ6074826.1 hypothetical protein [Microvirga puerhi]